VNPKLAQIFGTDRPWADRIAEERLMLQFTKSAEAEGVNLGDLSDADVLRTFDAFKQVKIAENTTERKTASLMRFGQLLAHRVARRSRQIRFDKIASGKVANDVHTVNAFLADAALDPDAALKTLGGSPHAALSKITDWVRSGLISPKNADALFQIATKNVSAMDPAVHATNLKDWQKAWGESGSAAHAAQVGTPKPDFDMSPREVHEKIRGGASGGGGFWQKWGPSGLLDAAKKGKWGTVGRKALLPAAGVLGIGALMGDRNKEQAALGGR